MDTTSAFVSQYTASLKMLEQAIIKADDKIWVDEKYKNPFWHVAYHALFCADLYLSENQDKYKRWEKFREGLSRLGEQSSAQDNQIAHPYTKDELIEYLHKILGSLKDKLEQTDFDAPSGFHWLPFNKFELQIYNIRHLQHHSGQLIERIRERLGVGVDWVSAG